MDEDIGPRLWHCVNSWRRNPFRVRAVDFQFPRVAAKRGDPGLSDETPSEYQSANHSALNGDARLMRPNVFHLIRGRNQHPHIEPPAIAREVDRLVRPSITSQTQLCGPPLSLRRGWRSTKDHALPTASGCTTQPPPHCGSSCPRFTCGIMLAQPRPRCPAWCEGWPDSRVRGMAGWKVGRR